MKVTDKYFIEHHLQLSSNKESVNGNRDVVLVGCKKDLMNFLRDYMDEGEEYFSLYANKISESDYKKIWEKKTK